MNAGNSRAVAIWLTDLEAENELELAEQTYVKSGGWRDEGRVFVLADRALTSEGTTDRYHVDPEDPQLRALRATTCAGDEEASKEAWRTAFAASPEMAAVLMGSLAAPLLHHAGARPFGIHLFGESSGGKTTVLSLAASAWGSGALDDQASFIGTWSSTPVAVEQRAATLSDLPTCLDEAHLMPADDRARVVYQVLSGQGKARGQKQGGLRRQLTWRTVLLSTGETALVADNAAVGANVRVIQLQFARPELTSSDVARLQRAAREHYGHIGPAFVRAMMAAPPANVRAWYAHMLDVAYRHAGTSPLDKRQAEAVAVLMQVEAACAELFGFGDPEGSTMLGLLGRDSARKEFESEASRGIEALTEWLSVRSSSFPHLVTDRQGRKVHPLEGHREVLGFIDEPAGLAHFLKGPCTEQLRRMGIDATVLMRGLRAQAALVTESSDQLSNRACVNGTRPRVYSVRLAALRQEPALGLAHSGRLTLVQAAQGDLAP